jgi:hypothetical protein
MKKEEYTIKEEPTPGYAKAMKDRKSFQPVKNSISMTNQKPQPSLGEQMRDREKRHDITLLQKIKDICDCCTDCSDCTFAMEMQAIDRCHRVKRNLIYIGVIKP